MELILGIDQGTTGTTVAFYNQNLECVAKANQEFEQHFPKNGWVEHRLDQIQESVIKAYQNASAQISQKFHLMGIGITNQRETVGAWDSHLKPLSPAIVWQDRRTSDRCKKLKKIEKTLHKKTGLLADPYFSGTKMEWMIKNYHLKGNFYLGTIDSFLVHWLTGKFYTDASNASRTMLCNLEDAQYDRDLLKEFKVKQEWLPEILPSFGEFGKTKGVGFLPDGIPVLCVLGDQQSALFGQQAWKKGQSKATYGTGSFILVNTGSERIFSKNKLLTTIAWKNKKEIVYALEGSAFVCGSLIQWLRDGLSMIHSSREIESLANQVKDTAGVQIVPALTGLGAPYWISEARGVITGITRGTTKAHFARAALWAMAIQNAKLLATFQKDGAKIKDLRVDGGACANNLLMQMQADSCGLPVIRPQNIESTVLGVILGAGIENGFFDISRLNQLAKIDRTFKPMSTSKQRVEFLKKYDETVEKT